ncbi:unnamed protein product, partial [Allacma fusca]
MKFLLIGAAIVGFAVATPTPPEETESKGLMCLEQRANEQNNKKIVESAMQEIFGNHDISAI